MSVLRAALPTMARTIPVHIGLAARQGRTQYVLEQLAPYDVNGKVARNSYVSPYRNTLLACCAAGQRTSNDATSDAIELQHVALARALLDRGADPNERDRMDSTPLHLACRGRGEGSPAMVALLLDLNRWNTCTTTTINLESLRYGKTPLVTAIAGFSYSPDPRQQLRCREIVHLLLREGAKPHGLDAANIDFQFEAVESTQTRGLRGFAKAKADSQSSPEHYLASKKLILDVRAAGSPRAYRMESRKRVLLLRSLALRGRAKHRDARMTFLVESPNEIAWKVLEYWRTELDC